MSKTPLLQQLFTVGGLVLLALCLNACRSPMTVDGASHPQVSIQTELGDIVVELYPDRAPVSVARFMQLVDSGDYNNTFFYRAMRRDNFPIVEWQPGQTFQVEQGGVIQAGLGERRDPSLAGIAHESTASTGLKHVDGALSFSRPTHRKATSEYIICIGDQPYLDHAQPGSFDGEGYAVFGRVIEGMDVVRQIHALPTKGKVASDRVWQAYDLTLETFTEEDFRLLSNDKLLAPLPISETVRLR